MPLIAAIIAAGGRGVRLGADRPKQFLDLAGRTMLERSIGAFAAHPRIDEIVVALPAEFVDAVAASFATGIDKPLTFVAGGRRRQDSVANAFAAVGASAAIVVIHDAARPFVDAALIDRTIDAARSYGAAIAAVPVRDTVKQAGGTRDTPLRPIASTLPREDIYLAQTPQAFAREVLARALEGGAEVEGSDEAMLAERAGFAVRLVEGDAGNIKITTAGDLEMALELSRGGPTSRVGTGYDLHRLAAGRPLILGGVTIPFEKGLDGHSDADIVCHAVTDAVLGAAGAGDIGRLFPDTDERWKDADSIALLTSAVERVRVGGYVVGNVDVTVVAERPKLLPYLEGMRANLARALGVDVSAVSIKGKTNERMDSMGRGESMACHAVALLIAAR